MKLRYQMRGLGIGIIVTALLMGVVKGDKVPLSDAEIRVRALELGMVESNSMKLSDIPNVIASPQPQGENPYGIDTVPLDGDAAVPENDGEQEPEAGEAAEPEGNEDSESSSAADDIGEPQGGDASGDAGDPEGDGASDHGTEQGENPESGESGAPGDGATVTFVIESGTTSYSVCKKLEEMGLVEDAGKFDVYVCDMGYSRKIRDGTYEIPKGATEEEILKIITRQ